MKGALGWLLAIGAGYWAYRNGLGAWVGVCPPGYQVVQDMFPACRNSMIYAGYSQHAKNPPPAQQLAFPLEWGWDGTRWVAVSNYPKWP